MSPKVSRSSVVCPPACAAQMVARSEGEGAPAGSCRRRRRPAWIGVRKPVLLLPVRCVPGHGGACTLHRQLHGRGRDARDCDGTAYRAFPTAPAGFVSACLGRVRGVVRHPLWLWLRGWIVDLREWNFLVCTHRDLLLSTEMDFTARGGAIWQAFVTVLVGSGFWLMPLHYDEAG